MDNALGLSELRGVIRRRWWLPALTLMIGAPLAVAVAIALPPVYSSTARILVEAQIIPENLARSTVSQSAGERIPFIRQQLMTRQNLLEVAEQNRVFADRRDLSPSDIVTLMTQQTIIRETAAGNRRDRSVIGLDITFKASRPRVAASVANDLVSRILTQNAETRTERASGTLAFFNQQVRRLEAEVAAMAAEIERYKTENRASLPESLGAREAMLNNLSERMFGLASQRTELAERLRVVEQTLEADQPAPSRQISPQERELEQLQNALITAGATLTDSHPTMRQLRARIEALSKAAADADADADADATPAAQRVAELEGQRNALARQLDLLDQQIADSQSRIAALEDSIARTPSVQIRLDGLERAYGGLQAQLLDVKVKQSEAEMGERLEASQQAERFQVVEQAIPSDDPVSPNRPMIIAAGVVGSGGVGVGLMLLMEMLRRPMRTAREMERRLEIQPLAAIPYIRTARELARRRWMLRGAAAAVVLGPATALAVLHFLVMPLPDAATRVVDAVGVNDMIASLSRRFGG